MNILVFEWMIGGGRILDNTAPDPDCPFERQGKAMASTVCQDFERAGHRPTLLLDSRIKEHTPFQDGKHLFITARCDFWTVLRNAVKESDYALIIAPESGNCLFRILQTLEDYSDKILNPNLEFVRLTTSKQATMDRLIESCGAGIEFSNGFLWNSSISKNRTNMDRLERSIRMMQLSNPSELNLRIKPDDGAGSEGQWTTSFENLKRSLNQIGSETAPNEIRTSSNESSDSKESSDSSNEVRVSNEASDSSISRESQAPSSLQNICDRDSNRIPNPGDRIEQEYSGTPASISCIASRNELYWLPPSRQVFNPHGHYMKANFDLSRKQTNNVMQLATRIVSVLRPTSGYFGMDMIIDAFDRATVLEINPRMTASYVQLREYVEDNLAERMLLS